MISFACISPHPPLLLPEIGSESDKKAVAATIKSLNVLGTKLSQVKPQAIVASSPHPDWGFNVPLHFLNKEPGADLITYLTGLESPKNHFKRGKTFYADKLSSLGKKIALIASGDLSHRLKIDGPYGFHQQGPKFDKKLIDSLKNNNIEAILNLEDEFPEAGECGLRSFCFMLGILDEARLAWKADILSYEGPFGVGYLVADLKL
jgi:aromatic ring-opening dioxygenase LigB subunit